VTGDAATSLKIKATESKDIGPACELAATAVGLVLRTEEDELRIAGYRDGSIGALAEDAKCKTTGPVSVIGGAPRRAYYVSKSRVLRREIREDGTIGASQPTVQDAADFTRVALARSGSGDLVAYIGREVSHELERGAKIWLEGKSSKPLTPEGSGATSIDLGQAADQSFVFLALDGRAAMSPVHATRIDVKAGEVKVGEDRVVYVAAGAERRSALRYWNNGESSLVLLPISHEASGFALLSLRLDTDSQDAPAQHYDYPNGLDPAPIATARLCGRHVAALVRPDSSAANSAHAIELVVLNETGLVTEKRKLLTAPSIKQLVIASVDDGKAAGYLAYTSTGRTHVAMLHCE